MEIYQKFKPSSILDFTCGWGGRLLGACALNIPKYIGIDINKNLEPCYTKMKNFLKENDCKTDIQLFFEDALNIDYTLLDYDMVFTSPPYFFLEKYSFNTQYKSKEEMMNIFYIPLFKKTFEYLKKGGYYCLNINNEIFQQIAFPNFGSPIEKIPLKKSKRQNDYKEFIYIWKKDN
jgi:tRNA1(Val) A37 N6-methylase TrmN6